MKDINQLNEKLSGIIRRFKTTNVSSNAAYDAPIDKHNLEILRDETAKTLQVFKDAIIEYLSE
ncbi:MAG: hypothetical protein ACM3TR_10935 [Caulobacteraceae bacterium]